MFDPDVNTYSSYCNVDDSKLSLIGINLTFFKNLKIVIEEFLKLHAPCFYQFPLLSVLLISFLSEL